LNHWNLSNLLNRSVVLSALLLYFRGDVPTADTPQPVRRHTRTLGRRARNRRLLHITLILVAAAIVLDALAGDRGLLAMLRVRGQYNALAATLSRERAENARLAEQARRLREDPTAVEEVARRELGLIRPGEKVFIIKDVPAPSPKPSPEP
jgi:cell division protein FtsB